ncbi:MAG: hypothetical protein E3J41_08095 [Candidatus Cloacimonadota bacterium]|nr:MAG: hypothetical protein E3J41_08095 [Candidatus Cloacimonadota bacterium]
MSVSVPGRIVVIDNVEEDVKDIIKSFWDSGESVIFFRSIPDEDKIPPNVRLLILDIALSGEEFREDEDIPQLALILKHIVSKTKLCLIVLWSRHIYGTGESFIDQIKEDYRIQTDKDIPSTIFFIQFGKTDVDQSWLAEKIRKWIDETPNAGIVFEWEKLIDNARDEAVSDIVSVGEIQVLLKSLEKEAGRDPLPRKLVSLFNRILQRHATTDAKIIQLKPLTEKILEQSLEHPDSLKWYRNLHYLIAYYKIAESEPLWTGDIFRTSSADLEKEYAIVITPACDFAQKKVGQFKVVYGLKFKVIPDYAQHGEEDIPPVVKKIGKKEKEKRYKNRKKISCMLISGSGLPQKFYILHFLKESKDTGEYFHLLFDFQYVDSFEIKPTDWERICRVDSPWIDDILQKYASLSARIGVPEIPEDVRKAEMEKLVGG